MGVVSSMWVMWSRSNEHWSWSVARGMITWGKHNIREKSVLRDVHVKLLDV